MEQVYSTEAIAITRAVKLVKDGYRPEVTKAKGGGWKVSWEAKPQSPEPEFGKLMEDRRVVDAELSEDPTDVNAYDRGETWAKTRTELATGVQPERRLTWREDQADIAQTPIAAAVRMTLSELRALEEAEAREESRRG